MVSKVEASINPDALFADFFVLLWVDRPLAGLGYDHVHSDGHYSLCKGDGEQKDALGYDVPE